MTNNTNSFELAKDSYVAFDATSIRQLIIDRLNEQKEFTDQNYIGSNLASIIDIISYTYHTLIYYLNKTSTESMFTEAQLYENINRIVKLLDYSPVGSQTSTLTFTCSATNLPASIYTIPRYSYVVINNIPYSFNEDVTFVKSQNNAVENLAELAEQKLLYQGLFQEHPIQVAAGDDNEIVILNPGTDVVDHFNIEVFVKKIKTNTWSQFTKTQNLYLENSNAEKFEIRLNGNDRYEIKFGNNINGVKLEPGDEVAIYYLSSLGSRGEVGAGAMTNEQKLIGYNTIQYNNIISNVFSNEFNFLTTEQLRNSFIFRNRFGSTQFKNKETPDEIRENAPSTYRSQFRLVTTQDFETFIKTNFANLITDVKCINNWDYISGYMKYFYDIGITDPSKTDRALFNQVLYADSCNFNNIYLIVVPRTTTSNADYLLPVQKGLINSSLLTYKMATTETVFVDPIYKAVSIGISSNGNFFEEDLELCQLQIIKDSSSRRSNNIIINDIVNLLKNYFNKINSRLGQIVDTRALTQEILNIEGIKTIYTARTDSPNDKIEGMSFAIWNPQYPLNDIKTTINSISLQPFEYPYFYDIDTIINRIVVITEPNNFETIEY
jgi:hypothetical protein